MTEPKTTKKPTRLRRICWLLTIGVVFVVGLYAFHSWRDNKQMAAIAEIERLGGHVDFVPSGVQVKVVVMSAVRSVVELTPSDSVPTLSPKRL